MTTEQKQEPKKAKPAGKETSELAHTIRDGAIAANIWRRQSQTGFPYYEFSRSYKSVSSGKTGYRTNYFSKNKEQLVKVVELASMWIAENEGETFPEQQLAA